MPPFSGRSTKMSGPRCSAQGQFGVLHGPTDSKVAAGLVPNAESPKALGSYAAIGSNAGPLRASAGLPWAALASAKPAYQPPFNDHS